MPWAIEEKVRQYMRHVDQTLKGSGVRMVVDVKKRMTDSPASGTVYPSRHSRRKRHKASAPGEPPSVDLGEYRNQIAMEFRKGTLGNPSEVVVGVRDGYEDQARALGFGRKDGTMAARPHFAPAWAAEQPRLKTAFHRKTLL